MAEIHINNLTKKFGDFVAVDDIEIKFFTGEVTCLLGPSGCGKTTLMRMIAGLESPTSGKIKFDEKDVTHIATSRRNVGMVFQYPVMYQTLSVSQNIAEPLKNNKSVSEEERQQRVDQMLEMLDMQDYANAFIDELDAGMRQKVAVGRAVARQTAIILFDEPTTNVPLNAKLQLIRALKEITSKLKQTIVYVTHDQTEAMTLADHIALMQDGKIVQYGTPRELYGKPTSTFGGWFLGNPGMNFVPAKINNNKLESVLLTSGMDVPSSVTNVEENLQFGIRPEQIMIDEQKQETSITGKLLEKTVGIGGRELLKVEIGDQVIVVKTTLTTETNLGDDLHLNVAKNNLLLFSGENRIDA